MRGLAITNIGIEDITSSEIKGVTAANTRPGKGCVVFETEKFEDFFKLGYRAQSILKVLLLFNNFKIKNIEDIKEQILKISLDEWINNKTTFAVRSWINNKNFNKQEVEAKTGEFIIDKTKAKVNLENPDTTFFVFIQGDDCYLGIDFSGGDLGKRDYRIFKGAEKIKPTIAYSLLRIADFKPEQVLLDPFCSAGTITIEAAIFATAFPVNYFNKDKFLFLRLKKFKDFDFEKFFDDEDNKINPKQKTNITAADPSFQAITAAKKNANIAGIIKSINFSRKEPKWLDTKFKEQSVDKIVSFPPQKTKFMSQRQIEKTYDELFHQAEFILKKEGVVVLLLKDTEIAEKAAKKYNFKIREKRKAMQGKEEFNIIVFVNKEK